MATIKQKNAANKIVENSGNISKTMKEVGYSKETAKNPKHLTNSKGWKELMKEHLPDKKLAKKHDALLNSTNIGHMVFPLAMQDKDIKSLLKTVNCTVKKIQHGDTANHVWYWASNDKARLSALDMAYKLKGKYAPDKIEDITAKKQVDDLRKELKDLINDSRQTKENMSKSS